MPPESICLDCEKQLRADTLQGLIRKERKHNLRSRNNCNEFESYDGNGYLGARVYENGRIVADEDASKMIVIEF